MSGPPDRPQHAVPAVVARCVAAVDEVAAAPLWSLSDAELLTLLDNAYALVSKVHALALSAVTEAGARDLDDRVGAPSMAALLRHRLRLTPAARRDVVLASAIASRHPVLATAVRGTRGPGGLVGSDSAVDEEPTTNPVIPIRVEQAAAIADVLADAPPAASAQVIADAEAALVGFAATLDAVQLRRLGTRIWTLVDPDDADATEAALLARQEARAHAARRLSLARYGDGITGITGQLDDFGAAVLRAALDPLAGPLPKTADGPDPRTAGQRLADALVELARRALANGDLPEQGGIPPQLVVTIDADRLHPPCTDHQGRDHDGDHGDQDGGTADTVTDATHAGITDGDTIDDGTGGIGTLDDGTRLSPTEVARLSCEADPIIALLTAGIPTWVTRRDRTARGVLRRALVLRDGGCAFPGCDRPASWCHAHHIVAWQDGGPTVLDNLVLLCGYHHRHIHSGAWTVVMADDGHPDFLPPPWIDPERRPLRNTTRDLLRT